MDKNDVFSTLLEADPTSERYGPSDPLPDDIKVIRSGEVQLWDQLENETSLAYSAFLVYVNLGPARTAMAAYRIYRNKPEATNVDGAWNNWVRKFKWAMRANAYDAWYRQRNLRQQEEVILNSLAMRTEKSAAIRDRMFGLSEALIDKAEKMLAFPLEEISRAEVNNGQMTVVTIKPIRWSVGDISTLLKQADLLRRMGAQAEEAPQLLRAEDIIEQLADSEGLTEEQKIKAVESLKAMTAEPKAGRSMGN